MRVRLLVSKHIGEFEVVAGSIHEAKFLLNSPFGKSVYIVRVGATIEEYPVDVDEVWKGTQPTEINTFVLMFSEEVELLGI